MMVILDGLGRSISIDRLLLGSAGFSQGEASQYIGDRLAARGFPRDAVAPTFIGLLVYWFIRFFWAKHPNI